MKTLILILVFNLVVAYANATQVIRINQLGYLPKSVKVAVFLSSETQAEQTFSLHNSLNDKIIFTGKTKTSNANNWGMKTAYRLNFSSVEVSGGYYLKVGQCKSPNFRINHDVYEGSADFILNYLRQQRCAYNPCLKDSCHLHDGIIVDHPTKSGQEINVTGGWHDASDYLQYSTTTVNTIYQMMFAYQNFPEIYTDKHEANGEPGKNNIPDIVDEIRWGLEWMLKMNPGPNEMYNQIADDRDHAGYRLPNKDSVDYDLGKHRPVYFVTGRPQGLAEHKNQSTGVSSIAGKFASGFALGAQLFKENDPTFANLLQEKALHAWHFALSDTGFCQTACNVSPYFYEERNYVDDLELGAAQLYKLTKNPGFKREAENWGQQEEISPWIRDGKARHYESYPFINLGHYLLAEQGKASFANYYKNGLQLLLERGKNDPFLNALPFIWCSNNLLAAAITQASLYQQFSGDETFAELEASLRDWLFGCNPWGTAMICGLPGVDDSPMKPHSSFTVLLGETTFGGLVDGPVYNTIYESLIGITLAEEDEYAAFNHGKAVYHDDIGDYSTNEPTMDGTASLSFLLANLENEGRKQAKKMQFTKDKTGSIIRIQPEEKAIFLAFTADSMYEGGHHVNQVLKANNCQASFFFTGNFLDYPSKKKIIEETIANGHYVGAHSDKHLLYCSWENQDSSLISREEFEQDLKNNYQKLAAFGIHSQDARFYMPPYEWCNQQFVDWGKQLGISFVNFTPGTGTNADYTTPEMKNYKSSEELFERLNSYEQNHPQGLNGAIVLLHPGTAKQRNDKFYLQLDKLIKHYTNKGYAFKAMNELN